MVFPPVTYLVESPTWSSASADGAVGRARYRARFPRSTGCRRVFVADGRRLRRALSSDIESPAAKADRTQIGSSNSGERHSNTGVASGGDAKANSYSSAALASRGTRLEPWATMQRTGGDSGRAVTSITALTPEPSRIWPRSATSWSETSHIACAPSAARATVPVHPHRRQPAISAAGMAPIQHASLAPLHHGLRDPQLAKSAPGAGTIQRRINHWRARAAPNDGSFCDDV